ncbi:MAG: O-antigen ligase family protein [Hahellaceae bacterium]|nr:O-antigen ligase family protein [Hahellaceae bacterium]MCP5210555.1 O-antigen ligase family protein [Hahellaceae bacterium]
MSFELKSGVSESFLSMASRGEKIFSVSLLLFIAASILQPFDDLSRAFFFFGVVPSSMQLIYRHRHRLWQIVSADRIFIVIMLLLSYLLISLFWTDEIASKVIFRYVRWWFETVFFILAAFLYAVLKMPVRFPHGVAILSIILLSSMISICNYFLLHSYPERLTGYGFLAHPILGASVLIMLWCVALLDRKVFASKIAIGLVSASLLFVFLFVVLTQSRGPLISLGVVCLFLLAGMIRRRTTFALSVLALSLLVFMLQPFIGDIAVLKNLTLRGDSYRIEIWGAVLKTAPDYWLFGNGLASEFGATETGQMVSLQSVAHPHNLWLSMLFYSGIIGVLLLLGLIMSLFVQCLRFERYFRIICFALVLLLNALCFTDTYRLISSPQAMWLIFWLPVALLVGYRVNLTPSGSESGR